MREVVWKKQLQSNEESHVIRQEELKVEQQTPHLTAVLLKKMQCFSRSQTEAERSGYCKKINVVLE